MRKNEKNSAITAIKLYIALDKRGYQENIFLIFPLKHMLCVFIRSTSWWHF